MDDVDMDATITCSSTEDFGSFGSTHCSLDDSTFTVPATIDEVLFGGSAHDNASASFDCENLDNRSYSDTSTDSLFESDDTVSVSSNSESDSEFYPSPAKKLRVQPVSMTKSIFVCETTQLQQLIDQVNVTSNCCTPRCTGKLVPVNVKLVGLGGAAIVKFACTGCTNRRLAFNSSVNVALSKCTVVSLAMQVAFVVAGCAHAQYSKVLKQCLGISSVSACTFYDTIKLILPEH